MEKPDKNFVNPNTRTLFIKVPEEGKGKFGEWLAVSVTPPAENVASSAFLDRAYRQLHKEDTAILGLLVDQKPPRISDEMMEKATDKLEEVT